MIERALGLLRHIDFALARSRCISSSGVRVDDLDVIGVVEHQVQAQSRARGCG